MLSLKLFCEVLEALKNPVLTLIPDACGLKCVSLFIYVYERGTYGPYTGGISFV